MGDIIPMNRETLKYILTDFQEKELPNTKPRELELPIFSEGKDSDKSINKIVSLIGVRRSGKTFLFYDTMRKLIASGIDKRNIIYLNFEDDRLFPINAEQLDMILKAYHELYPEKVSEKKYLFFDEIQNIQNWEKYIRRIHDTENVLIFLTGSSSEFLSRDISTALRGRSISYQLAPLSFWEYLTFKDITYNAYSSQSQALVKNELINYLTYGGFPEIALADQKIIKEKILSEYIDLIQYKDMVERYKITNQYLLKYLLKFCLTHPANLLSVNKLFNDFKAQGLSLSKNTIYEYLEYLQESFIISLHSKYSDSMRKQKQNPKKIYTIDNGLMLHFQPDEMSNIGYKLENAVAAKFRQKYNEIFYYSNKFEVDFLIKTHDSILLYNVADNIDDLNTAKRELTALQKGAENFSHSQAYLILKEQTEREITPPINVVSIIDFLLEE